MMVTKMLVLIYSILGWAISNNSRQDQRECPTTVGKIKGSGTFGERTNSNNSRHDERKRRLWGKIKFPATIVQLKGGGTFGKMIKRIERERARE